MGVVSAAAETTPLPVRGVPRDAHPTPPWSGPRRALARAGLPADAHDAEHGGYFEALTRGGTPILGWEEGAPVSGRADRLGVYYGFKTMNSHIYLLEALAGFYRVEPTPPVERRLRELLALVRDRIAVEPGALNLYLTRDWRAAPAHDSLPPARG